MENKIALPFTLPCGVELNNRIVKAAMTERLSRPDYLPNEFHQELYRRWAEGNASVLITGNVMVEKGHMESAGNVVLAEGTSLDPFRKWTEAAKKQGNHIWAQISHSGRQTSKFIRWRPRSASDVQLHKMGLFGKPIPLNENEIEEVIHKYISTARLAKESGFTGVQVHAAHGYLISQFLSPHTNRREDQWGGSIENRSRLLRLIVQGIRSTNGPGFPISVKLNSADFQRGGFSEEDSMWVVKMLEEEGIDLLEISGGTYERVAFFEENISQKESTKKREAYFLDFADKIRDDTRLPIMVTGGFRSSDFMNSALGSGQLDMIGLARPFINDLEKIAAMINGETVSLQSPTIQASIKMLNDSAEAGYYAKQIFNLAKGKNVDQKIAANSSSLWLIQMEMGKGLAKKFS